MGFGGKIKWTCEADLEKGIAFGKQDIECKKAPDKFFDDDVLPETCRLIYSIRKPWPTVVIVLVVIGSTIFVLIVAVAVYKFKKSRATPYTTHSPTAVHMTTTVSSLPTAPVIASTYYPQQPPAYSTTSVAFSGTSYRNDAYDNTPVTSGFASTTFRTDNNSFGMAGGDNDYYPTKTDTAFSGTSYR